MRAAAKERIPTEGTAYSAVDTRVCRRNRLRPSMLFRLNPKSVDESNETFVANAGGTMRPQ